MIEAASKHYCDLIRNGRTAPTVAQQHDGPDGDRLHERNYATVTTLASTTGPRTVTDTGTLDCSDVPLGPDAQLDGCDLAGLYLVNMNLTTADLSFADVSFAALRI